MLICDLKKRDALKGARKIRDCMKMVHTLDFQRKYDTALRHVEEFLSVCKRPVVSCGGGKDSTATAIICRHIDPDIPIVCGDPPNPLSDREKHVDDLARWLGGSFVRIPYSWDVKAVLSGRVCYPENLKQRVLSAYHKEHGIDGVVLGLRVNESKSRRIVFQSKGAVYRMQAGWRCLPVVTMSAEEVLCIALLHDAPINPVYSRQKGDFPFEFIRDGTWWPHGLRDISGWIREYYPEHYEDYKLAMTVYDAQKEIVRIL